MTALSCEDVSMRFGSFAALSNVSLRFERNRFYGLIGPNGAGKTTLINVLSGALTPSNGCIELRGKRMTKARRHEFAREGLSRSFQTSSLFNELTARESLVLALQSASPKRSLWADPMRNPDWMRRADEMLERLRMTPFADARADALAHGYQRLLDLGVAFIGDGDTVLLDEPFAGIGLAEIEETERSIRMLSTGKTVVMVEHNMNVLMRLAEEIVVLAGGKVLAQGAPADVRANPAVRGAYLGNHA